MREIREAREILQYQPSFHISKCFIFHGHYNSLLGTYKTTNNFIPFNKY